MANDVHKIKLFVFWMFCVPIRMKTPQLIFQKLITPLFVLENINIKDYIGLTAFILIIILLVHFSKLHSWKASILLSPYVLPVRAYSLRFSFELSRIILFR